MGVALLGHTNARFIVVIVKGCIYAHCPAVEKHIIIMVIFKTVAFAVFIPQNLPLHRYKQMLCSVNRRETVLVFFNRNNLSALNHSPFFGAFYPIHMRLIIGFFKWDNRASFIIKIYFEYFRHFSAPFYHFFLVVHYNKISNIKRSKCQHPWNRKWYI